MIFKPELARAIIRGKKTQTRRPVKWKATDDIPYKVGKLKNQPVPAKRAKNRYVDASYPNKAVAPCRYKVDHDYALQRGRGVKADNDVRIKVTAVRQEKLGALTYEDAVAEGFRTRDEFFAYWEGLYQEKPDPELPVWVITFEPTFPDEYLTDNRDPRKGPLDIVNTPPQTGGMKDEPQVAPRAYVNLVSSEAKRREVTELAEYLKSLEVIEAALASRLRKRPEINGEVQRAKRQIMRAKEKLKGQLAHLERAA